MVHRRLKVTPPAREVPAYLRQTRSRQPSIYDQLVAGTQVPGLVGILLPPPVLTEAGDLLDSAPPADVLAAPDGLSDSAPCPPALAAVGRCRYV